MTPLVELHAVAAPLPLPNIDTDKIIPGRFLKTVSRDGLASALFDSLRRLPDGTSRSDFILNRAPYDRASILIALENFGCGSSREHAPWALLEFGIRCIIAPSFADIFYNNCIKNGMLPVSLARPIVDALLTRVSNPAEAVLHVSLEDQTVKAGGETYFFPIAPAAKRRLLEGLDEIALTLTHAAAIDAYESGRLW